MVKNSKFGPFLRASEVLGGLRSREEKTTTTPLFFEQKLEYGLIYEKKNTIFVVQGIFEKLDFFHLLLGL